jgi:MATE family multidrug resistance protein
LETLTKHEIRKLSLQRKPSWSSIKAISKLGLPLLFGQLAHFVHQIADSAMLGHYGKEGLELGAMGIAGLFTWMLMTLLWPLSVGVQGLASRRFGRQQDQQIQDGEQINRSSTSWKTGEVLDTGLIVAMIAAGFAWIISLLAPWILGVLVDSHEIRKLSLEYIGIMRWALIPNGMFIVLQGFSGAINQTKPVMISGLLSNIINVGLNWIFIFGNLGFPALGIRGAALGTGLSAVISALFMFLVAFRHRWPTNFGVFRYRSFSLKVAKGIVETGIAPCIQNFIALGIFLVYQTLIESYGPIYLAATHSMFAFFRLNKTIIGGFARSGSILAGNALGRKDYAQAETLATSAGLLGAILAGSIALLALLLRSSIAQVFSPNPQVQQVMSQGMMFFVGFYAIEALGYTYEMIFTGNGHGKYVLASEFSTNILFILGATLLSRMLFPDQILWAWLSFGLYQLVHALLMIRGWLSRSWLASRIHGDDE